MTILVYRYRNFDKLLNRLRNAGGNASLAARNADELINKLEKGDNAPGDIGRQTKHGEARIKNCLKYNLGNGYRLICVKQRWHLVLLYVGTHDDCDLWLDKNRELRVVVSDDNQSVSFFENDEEPAPVAWQEFAPEIDEYEEMLLKKIDDRILRQVFCGLCRQRA